MSFNETTVNINRETSKESNRNYGEHLYSEKYGDGFLDRKLLLETRLEVGKQHDCEL